jgi:hypothetical protein
MRLLQRILDAAGVSIIDRRIHTTVGLRAEGRRRFACLGTPDAAAIIKGYHPGRQRRMVTDQVFLVKMAYWLGLQRRPPCRILDIGSFNGMWPYLCRSYGHDAVCTDLPEVLARPAVKSMIDLLKVPSFPLRIEALKPPDLGGRTFDLITGLRTRFHSTKPAETGLSRETHWGVAEWDCFLRGIAAHLPPEGQVFFMLNRLRENPPGGIPPEMAKYFRDAGGDLNGMYLWFRNVSKLKSGAAR